VAVLQGGRDPALLYQVQRHYGNRVTRRLVQRARSDSAAIRPAREGGRAPRPSSIVLTGGRPAAGPQAMPVLQRRLPTIDTTLIKRDPNMVRDLLLHGLKNLDEKERKALVAQYKSPPRTFDEVVGLVRDAKPDKLEEWYTFIAYYTGAEKKYVSTYKQADTIKPTTGEVETLVKHLTTIISGLQKLHGNAKLQKLIFGPDCDHKLVDGVYRDIWERAYKHTQKGAAAPVVRSADKAHKEWVGVGGSASMTGEHVELSDTEYSALIKGTSEGFAVLVHEFSHQAKDATEDITYDFGEMARLRTEARQKNAETYAQAYLEATSTSDQRRHYDPKKVIAKTPTSGSKPNEFLERRVQGVVEYLTAMWNHMDDAYNIAKTLARRETLKESTQKSYEWMVGLAVYPYKLDLGTAPDAFLALIEDRTRRLNDLTASGAVRSALMAQKVTKEEMTNTAYNADKELPDLTAKAVKAALNMTNEVAQKFVAQWIQFQQDLKKSQDK
jgi:hypothetical protein